MFELVVNVHFKSSSKNDALNFERRLLWEQKFIPSRSWANLEIDIFTHKLEGKRNPLCFSEEHLGTIPVQCTRLSPLSVLPSRSQPWLFLIIPSLDCASYYYSHRIGHRRKQVRCMVCCKAFPENRSGWRYATQTCICIRHTDISCVWVRSVGAQDDRLLDGKARYVRSILDLRCPDTFFQSGAVFLNRSRFSSYPCIDPASPQRRTDSLHVWIWGKRVNMREIWKGAVADEQSQAEHFCFLTFPPPPDFLFKKANF